MNAIACSSASTGFVGGGGRSSHEGSPVRQLVLSLPFELRRLAAFKPAVLTALSRIFVDSVFGSYRSRARRAGTGRLQCGALTFVQQFGGSLNLNLHFHSVFLDGVFTRDDQRRAFFSMRLRRG